MVIGGFSEQPANTAAKQNIRSGIRSGIRWDESYFKTVPGILKCIQLILNIVGIICIYSSYYWIPRATWFRFVAVAGVSITSKLLAFYLFHIVERFYKIPWLKIECIFCAIWTVFYLIASCLVVRLGLEAYDAAGAFGFCAMIAYGCDGFLKLRAIINGDTAQGEPIVNKELESSETFFCCIF